MFTLSQLPAPPTGAIEAWLLSAAAVASMAVLAKKLFLRKSPLEPEHVTKTEFHHELGTLRDKIDARFLTLTEKLDPVKGESLSAPDPRTAPIPPPLTTLESNVARLDERTKR